MVKQFDARARWLAAHILPREQAIRARLRRVGGLSPPDIDDLVQETYAVLAGRAKVEDIVDPVAYAIRVARSLLLQRIRRAKVVPLEFVSDLSDLDPEGGSAAVDDEVCARLELRKVVRAIESMPAQTRRAFWLRRVEGLSQREIAAELDLSESTIEKHIGRGIKSLIQQFGRGGNRRRSASQDGGLPRSQEIQGFGEPSRVRREP